MFMPSFNGCWAKIEWAKKHRDAFDGCVAETIASETNHPTIGIKFKPETSCYIVYVSKMPDLDLFLTGCALFMGDILHNLRSALDHLTFQLALGHKDGRLEHEDRVQFPIEDEPEDFERRKRKRGYIAELSVIDQGIIEEFQPYHRRHEGRTLAMLRDCSNADKHRLLVPVVVPAAKFDKVDLAVNMIVMSHIRREKEQFGIVGMRTVELGAELFWSQSPHWEGAKMNMDVAGRVTPQIAFDWQGRFIRPIIAIDQIAGVVTRILRRFDPQL